MLSPTQEALLALLKPNSEFDFSTLSAEDWEAVRKESISQAVPLLAIEGTLNHTHLIPNDVSTAWFNLSMQYLVKNSQVLSAQNKLIKILEDNNFPYIILKGLASASYYPDPTKRVLGDVDFLILPEQQPLVEEALINAGYKKELDEHICHRVFKKPHEHLEMHFEVAGIPNGNAGTLFRNYLKNAALKYTNNKNPNFNNPLPQIHAAIILLHTIHHLLGEGIGLRHLCDWAYFIEKTHTYPFWQEEFLPLLKKSGTFKFACVITKTAHIYLGTACPEWAKDIEQNLCEQVIEDLFSSGNFGKKDSNRAGAGRMISLNGKNGTKNNKFKNQILTLCGSMYYLYPFLRKWKILYPFVFVWRIIRYLILMLFGKRPSLIKANAYANERLAVYKQFELYENTEE
ncbi:MAG: hypothetical protein E7537_00215 [Ruminococcaceae bacterium]|nr:hypothetical protein [Oscillospiraceae bacterium]